jgi:hypothetical protein
MFATSYTETESGIVPNYQSKPRKNTAAKREAAETSSGSVQDRRESYGESKGGGIAERERRRRENRSQTH